VLVLGLGCCQDAALGEKQVPPLPSPARSRNERGRKASGYFGRDDRFIFVGWLVRRYPVFLLMVDCRDLVVSAGRKRRRGTPHSKGL